MAASLLAFVSMVTKTSRKLHRSSRRLLGQIYTWSRDCQCSYQRHEPTRRRIKKSVDDENAKGGDDMDVRLAKLLESQPRPTTVQRTYTEEERKIREAILAQYSQMSDEEESGVGNEAEPKENGMMKNTNASVVQQAEKEKREKSKLDSQKKKDKDKEDRERQKQQALDKKEKRKTQKGERRR
uniref:Coiled-coil domain-containing protein 43 n=1 Tax=Timema shepardi TaxID=629360 RepID=A0A7R9G467_TIMSH|nr:unnamed protein product [Timema shepardi]